MSITVLYSPLLLNGPECFLTFSFYRFVLHSCFLPEATLALFPFPSQPTLEFSTPLSQATSHTVAFCNTASLTYFPPWQKKHWSSLEYTDSQVCPVNDFLRFLIMYVEEDTEIMDLWAPKKTRPTHFSAHRKTPMKYQNKQLRGKGFLFCFLAFWVFSFFSYFLGFFGVCFFIVFGFVLVFFTIEICRLVYLANTAEK